MEKRSKKHRLKIYMNDICVGSLIKFTSGALEFHYEPEWINRRISLPISRSMPVREQPYIGEIVFNYFDNLLPDNQSIRQIVARKTQADSTDAFDILSKIGRDCVGALQLLPEGVEPDGRHEIRAHPINDCDLAERLRNLKQNPLGLDLEEDFRISIAGAQEKTAFLLKDGQWQIPLGSTPTTHIFKTSMGVINDIIDMGHSVENEWLCLKLCKAFDLPTADAEIANFDGVQALVITRFDRRWVDDRLFRIPQEDICQALAVPSNKKYEADGGPGIFQVMDILNESSRRATDRRTFMKAQVVFWVLAAIDGHAKNFSLFLMPTGFTMTPLYDVLSAFPITATGRLQEKKIKMAMAVGDNRHWKPTEIYRRHWLQTAKKARFPAEEMDGILNEVAVQVPRVIEQVSAQLPTNFRKDVSEPIFAGMLKQAQKLATTD